MPVFLSRSITQNETTGHDREYERKNQSKEKGEKFSIDVLNLSDKGDTQVEMSNVYWDDGQKLEKGVCW